MMVVSSTVTRSDIINKFVKGEAVVTTASVLPSYRGASSQGLEHDKTG
jgi:hypothetical protein